MAASLIGQGVALRMHHRDEMCEPVHQRWSQWGLDSALRKLFPLEWLQGFRLPVLDDLVNKSPFLDYGNFLTELGLDADAPGGASDTLRNVTRLAACLRE